MNGTGNFGAQHPENEQAEEGKERLGQQPDQEVHRARQPLYARMLQVFMQRNRILRIVQYLDSCGIDPFSVAALDTSEVSVKVCVQCRRPSGHL